MELYAFRLDANKSVSHAIRPGRALWLQLIAGELHVEGQKVYAGDAVRIEGQKEAKIKAEQSSHFLLFDLS